MTKKKEDKCLKPHGLQKKGGKEDQALKKELGESVANIANPIFKKNLQALFQQDEILAARLWGMEGMKGYDVFIGKDPIDINIINNKTLKYVYENPVKDVKEALENIEKEYKRYPIMYFYGLGNGIFYKALLKNETHQKIVVVEPEVEIIYAVLNLVDLSQELLSERLIIFFSEFTTYSQFYYIVSKPEFTPYAKTYNLHVHTHFYDDFNDDIIKINKNFAKAVSQTVIVHGNSIDDMLIGIKHHIEHIPEMVSNYCYTKLIKKRHKLIDTAIVVSTGPSLDKQLDTLKKFAPYVTVISLDASYPILLKHGIKPDYVTSIERVEATASFFKHKNKKFDENIYFVVASLTHGQTVKNILPRRLVLTMRPHQGEMAFNMPKYGYLGAGHSTANQAYQLAYVLGHKNIVLIGQDLAFAPDGKSHATGHAFAQADEYLYTVAYGGEGEVRTTYVWDKFKNQFESDIEHSSKKDVITYNCTEGGARILGCIEKPFLETMQELCKDKKTKSLPNIEKNDKKISNKDLMVAYKYIVKKIGMQTMAKEKIEKVFLEIVPKIDGIMRLRDSDKITENLLNDLLKITDKIDKIKNFLVQKRFKSSVENILQMAVYYQELELAKISVAPSDTVMQKVNKLVEWVEMHKYWLFSAAGGLNAEIEVTRKASKNLVKELKKRGLITKDEIGKAKEDFTLSI
ncbi:motility associated factor glycosyltransferase family protein [Campylobacter rectus]|uniref:motility associated factor glycosyltransferase family protein n=1 Tax=Campylobacter rectus TaxID=203 RepID=UPI0023F25B04|nr:6-hydroxymethylpterin diphosphokinase MptE-like protein [Campylobacter rectus]